MFRILSRLGVMGQGQEEGPRKRSEPTSLSVDVSDPENRETDSDQEL